MRPSRDERPARVCERPGRETLARVDAIDQLLVAHAHNWRLERMAVIDRLVLRLAVCELLTHPETPPKVVINEALELARTFSGDESVAFVNGVLDAVRKALPEPLRTSSRADVAARLVAVSAAPAARAPREVAARVRAEVGPREH